MRPLFHPLIAAKEFVTADHIGEGRLGVNLVVGWNEGEFDMFGVDQREHAARYGFAQEWLDVVKRAWSDDGEFDFEGEFLRLKAVRAYPKPYGGTRPIIINAGSSEAGQAFALRNCDAFFVATAGRAPRWRLTRRRSPRSSARRKTSVARSRSTPSARSSAGRARRRRRTTTAMPLSRMRIGVRSRVCSPTRASLLRQFQPDEYYKKRQYFASHAIGGYPFVGTPDRVADELESISKAGVRGIALSFVNYLDELPYFCAEVLPRLVRLGARSGVPASHFS